MAARLERDQPVRDGSLDCSLQLQAWPYGNVKSGGWRTGSQQCDDSDYGAIGDATGWSPLATLSA